MPCDLPVSVCYVLTYNLPAIKHSYLKSQMATESVANSVNGSGGLHQNYGLPEQSSQVSGSTSGSLATGGIGDENAAVTNPGEPSTTNTSEGGNSNVPKDEVGWYFVEQYYTTLSKTPEKLHVILPIMSMRLSSYLQMAIV